MSQREMENGLREALTEAIQCLSDNVDASSEWCGTNGEYHSIVKWMTIWNDVAVLAAQRQPAPGGQRDVDWYECPDGTVLWRKHVVRKTESSSTLEPIEPTVCVTGVGERAATVPAVCREGEWEKVMAAKKSGYDEGYQMGLAARESSEPPAGARWRLGQIAQYLDDHFSTPDIPFAGDVLRESELFDADDEATLRTPAVAPPETVQAGRLTVEDYLSTQHLSSPTQIVECLNRKLSERATAGKPGGGE